VREELFTRVERAYGLVRVGDPRASSTLVGPLIDGAAFEAMQAALVRAKKAGGTVVGGERIAVADCDGGFYVKPAIVRMPSQTDVVKEETFAPILYVMEVTDLDDAIRVQNDVPQGLSSALFTTSMKSAERFLSHAGSDCGIANVNIGTSGAEIGGAFGGEKETGGGREAGSDSWKAYMRRQTNTLNWGDALPLAQGVTFEI
jgi:aldehyde dehydrogenase (NAD+)